LAKNNIPTLSPAAVGVIAGLGFRPLPGMSHTFVGKADSQNEGQDPYMVIMQIMPLQLDADRYVVSLTYNGQDAFKARLGTLEELQEWFATYAVFNDIDVFVRSQVA
jgi:hypothetical protein